MSRLSKDKKVDAFVRFWTQVHIGTVEQCWPWQGGTDSDGYGIFSDEGRKSVRAHRYAFRCATGREARPMALHGCNFPPCCNPSHLYEGSARQNIDDCIRAGNFRTVFVSGERHPNSRLTDEEKAEALRLISLGHTQKSVARRFGVTPSALAYHRRKK